MTLNEISWRLGGEAGYGILTAGAIFAKALFRSGLSVFTTSEYPSIIRGGHNIYNIRASTEKIYAQTSFLNLLAALDSATIKIHAGEVHAGGGIIFDEEETPPQEKEALKSLEVSRRLHLFSAPLRKFAKEAGEAKIMINSAALGASAGVVGLDFENLVNVIKDTYGGKKGAEIAEANIKVAKQGYEHVKQNFAEERKALGFNFEAIKKGDEKSKKILINGNEALCLGSLKAGCRFIAVYPMTPTSSILHFMAAQEAEHKLVVLQPEDEISGILMAIGAGYAGVRSMAATSGGGFSLMVESLGLAGSAEVPVVIVLGQRPGPSTGLPTWTEQGDLRFALHASQGEFPRILIAPGDAEECFYAAVNSFNLAEKYQCPVVFLTDKYLAESSAVFEEFDSSIKIERGALLTEEKLMEISESPFKRYRFTASGISPRSIPSQKLGVHLAKGEEHDELGNFCEDAENRKKMMEKRMKKLDEALKELPEPKIYGSGDAEVTIVGWGSTKMQVLEAMKMLEKEKIKTKFLHLVYIHPFPSKKVAEVLSTSQSLLIVENNFSAQMAGLIREKTGIEIMHRLLRYDGRPFYPEEICAEVKKVFKRGHHENQI